MAPEIDRPRPQATPEHGHLPVGKRRRQGRLEEAAEEICRNLRFRRNVERLCEHGPRVVGAFIAELAARRSIRSEVEAQLERYADLTPEAVAVTDAGDLPPNPMTAIDGGRR